MKTLKEIHEGFFDNVGGICPQLNDFLKANKDRIVELKGKEYIVKNGKIFDVTDLKNTVYQLMDRKTIKINKDGKKYRDIIGVDWQVGGSYIGIKYYFYTLVNVTNDTKPDHYETYCFHSVLGQPGGKLDKDQLLIDFLKMVSK